MVAYHSNKKANKQTRTDVGTRKWIITVAGVTGFLFVRVCFGLVCLFCFVWRDMENFGTLDQKSS